MKFKHIKLTFLLSMLCQMVAAQSVCSSAGNLMIYSNYDGGIVTINVDANIPNLKIGICTYEPVRVTLTGTYLSNVTQVVYAGFNSMQNNNNCGQGNFVTSISGVPVNKIKIQTYPEIGYDNPNGWPNMVGVAGLCDANTNAGGGNTPDQVVYYFEQETGGTLYAHFTQYNCWQNDVYKVSDGGNCCVLPNATGPQASFSASATELCQATCIDFTNTSTGGPFTDVSWEFEGGEPALSSDPAPSVCYADPGVYNVKLTVTGVSGSKSIVKTGYITVNESAALSGFAYPEPICPNEQEVAPITDTDFIPGGTWSAEQGLSLDPQTGNINPLSSEAGNYTVTYTINPSSCYSSNSVSFQVEIEAVPDLSLKPSGEVLLCEGDAITLNGPEGYSDYTWTGSSGNGQRITVDSPGTYSLSLLSDAGCQLYTDTAFVSLLNKPAAAFSYLQGNGYQVQFTNNSENSTSYHWYFPDADSSNEENPAYEFLYDDTWPLRLIARNACGADTLDTTVVVIKTGISTISANRLSMFRQGDNLSIRLQHAGSGDAMVCIYDLSGKMVLEKRFPAAGASDLQVPIADLPGGLFLISLRQDHSLVSARWFNAPAK